MARKSKEERLKRFTWNAEDITVIRDGKVIDLSKKSEKSRPTDPDRPDNPNPAAGNNRK